MPGLQLDELFWSRVDVKHIPEILVALPAWEVFCANLGYTGVVE